MEDNEDWGYEPSDENAPSALELFADVVKFFGLILLVVIRIAVPIAVTAFGFWLLFKLTIFLMGV